MKRAIRYTIFIVVIFSILSGCFQQKKEPLDELTQLLNEQQSVEHYTFAGTAALTNNDQNRHHIEWQGNANLNYVEATMRSMTNNDHEQELMLRYDGKTTYVHIPNLNNDDEWMTTTSFLWSYDEYDSALIVDFIKQHKEELTEPLLDFHSNIDEDGKRTIQFTPDGDIAQRWLEKLSDKKRETLPTALHLLFDAGIGFTNSSDETSSSAQLTFDNEDQLLAYEIHINNGSFSFQVKQSYDRMQHIPQQTLVNQDETVLLPVEQIWETVQQLSTDSLHSYAYEHFEESIELIEDYAYDDADRQQIVHVIKAGMQALIDRDDQSSLSNLFGENWSSKKKFRLKSIEDLANKSFVRQARVAVLYEFVDKDDAQIQLSGFIFTLDKDDEGNWNIKAID